MSKVPSILLNRDFYTKPRNRKWIKEQGAEAVIILQTFWIASSQEKSCKIKKDEASCIPYPLPLEESRIREILDSAVKVGLLDSDKEHYFNSQIIDDQENFSRKQENYKKGREKNKSDKQDMRIVRESSENPPRILNKSSEKHLRIPMNTEYMNTELLNTEYEFRKEGTGGNPLIIPEHPPKLKPPEDLSKLTEDERICEERLEAPNGQPWTESNAFINAGRRPMKKYPEILLTRQELVNVIQNWRNSKIPVEKWDEIFKKAQAQVNKSKAEGSRTDNKNFYSWLTGFLKTEMLEEILKETRIQIVRERVA